MSPEEFSEWRKRLGMTRAQAASELGRSVDWLRSAEIGRRKIERVVELACELIEMRREPE